MSSNEYEFDIWKTVADIGNGLLLQEKYIITAGFKVTEERPATNIEDKGLSTIGAIAKSGEDPHTGEETIVSMDRRIVHISEVSNVKVSEKAMAELSDLDTAGDLKDRESASP